MVFVTEVNQVNGSLGSLFGPADDGSPVLVGRARNPVLLVAFGGLGGSVGIPPFEFFGLTADLPVDRVFVRDAHRAFYQRGLQGIGHTLPSLVRPLQELVEGARHVVAIGVSAGGYAALALGPQLGADRIVAINPITTLRPLHRALARDRRWGADVRRARAACVDPRYLDIAELFSNKSLPETEVHFAGGSRLDRWHTERIRHLPGVTARPYGSSTHLMAKEMRDSGYLRSLVLRVLTFDDAL